MRTVLVTGSAGFIGYHLCQLLIAEGFIVVGYDAITDYYDTKLKRDRHEELKKHNAFSCVEGRLEDYEVLSSLVEKTKPNIIVHLAAQPGVRYSLENPRAYVDTNVMGTFNVMECARIAQVDHLLMASTSSVYGANLEMPYRETDKVDHQMTIYAATKKSTEMMAHSYAHLWDLPTTMFRFFTVYGPWGRPDMAFFKFTDAILNGRPIDVFNNGDMYRDFTYVEDLVRGIRLIIDAVPQRPDSIEAIEAGDSLSPVAPHRIVNIGNGEKVRLLDYIDALEEALGTKAERNYLPMQPGDVAATWADTSLLKRLTGFEPQVDYREGIGRFVEWYRAHYKV